MELWYAYHLFKGSSASLLKYFKSIREYQVSRGMSYWTDIKDWLGGWPMEFAGITETKDFCNSKLQLELINIKAGEGNTEYLFRKTGSRNYWDKILETSPEIKLELPFQHIGGYAWAYDLPTQIQSASNEENPARSRLMLYEDMVPMGFANVPLSHIESYGNSRYTHWNDNLYFSATDNTDPNQNGRVYSIRLNMLS